MNNEDEKMKIEFETVLKLLLVLLQEGKTETVIKTIKEILKE